MSPFCGNRGGSLKLTDLLAIYGAVLSTAVFLWNAVRARPKVKVRLVYASEKDENDDLQFGVRVFVQNPSAHTVHITAISLLYPWKKVGLGDRLAHIVKYRSLPTRVGWVSCGLALYGVSH